MNKLPYLIILIVFFVPFLTRGIGILPGPAVLIFELTAGVIFMMALVYGAFYKSFSVSPKYLVLFLVVCLHFMGGAILNSVEPSVVFSGIRNYLKYMPLFLLPLVYAFSDKEIAGQFKFLIALGLLQLPIASIQFFILGYHEDLVAGTFVIGSIMSIFMVSVIAILTAFYFRERISGRMYILLGLLIFIPTTLNESKGTVIMMILGLLVIMLGTTLKRSHIVMAISTLGGMLLAFIVIYNMHFSDGGTDFMSYFTTDPNRGAIHYLYSGDSIEIAPETALDAPSSIIGALPSLDPEEARIRRLDALVLPVRVLSNDFPRLLFGLGIGNASDSRIGPFKGEYSFLAMLNVSMPLLPILIWEIGIVGVFLYLLFFYFIFHDARKLSRSDSFSGAVALGWTGVVVILALSLPYKNFMIFEAPGALFWYLSGYIAAQRVRIALKNTSPAISNSRSDPVGSPIAQK